MTPEEIRERGKVVGFLLALPGILIFILFALALLVRAIERLFQS
jgi:hypothetical protein